MPAKTRPARIADVRQAMDALPEFIAAALAAEDAATDPATDRAALDAWADVELYGATLHRQARLLAGKTRGG